MPVLLKLSCPDRVGLLASIANLIADHGGNLLEVHQFTDSQANWFFTRMAIESLPVGLPELREEFGKMARDLNAEWTIRESESRMKVILMVSKLGHCLADLLWRWHSGELAFDIACVISNHPDFRSIVEREGIEFHHVPVEPDNKPAAFAEVARLVRKSAPDLVVL